jgi:hypothetical protein
MGGARILRVPFGGDVMLEADIPEEISMKFYAMCQQSVRDTIREHWNEKNFTLSKDTCETEMERLNEIMKNIQAVHHSQQGVLNRIATNSPRAIQIRELLVQAVDAANHLSIADVDDNVQELTVLLWTFRAMLADGKVDELDAAVLTGMGVSGQNYDEKVDQVSARAAVFCPGFVDGDSARLGGMMSVREESLCKMLAGVGGGMGVRLSEEDRGVLGRGIEGVTEYLTLAELCREMIVEVNDLLPQCKTAIQCLQEVVGVSHGRYPARRPVTHRSQRLVNVPEEWKANPIGTWMGLRRTSRGWRSDGQVPAAGEGSEEGGAGGDRGQADGGEEGGDGVLCLGRGDGGVEGGSIKLTCAAGRERRAVDGHEQGKSRRVLASGEGFAREDVLGMGDCVEGASFEASGVEGGVGVVPSMGDGGEYGAGAGVGRGARPCLSASMAVKDGDGMGRSAHVDATEQRRVAGVTEVGLAERVDDAVVARARRSPVISDAAHPAVLRGLDVVRRFAATSTGGPGRREAGDREQVGTVGGDEVDGSNDGDVDGEAGDVWTGGVRAAEGVACVRIPLPGEDIAADGSVVVTLVVVGSMGRDTSLKTGDEEICDGFAFADASLLGSLLGTKEEVVIIAAGFAEGGLPPVNLESNVAAESGSRLKTTLVETPEDVLRHLEARVLSVCGGTHFVGLFDEGMKLGGMVLGNHVILGDAGANQLAGWMRMQPTTKHVVLLKFCHSPRVAQQLADSSNVGVIHGDGAEFVYMSDSIRKGGKMLAAPSLQIVGLVNMLVIGQSTLGKVGKEVPGLAFTGSERIGGEPARSLVAGRRRAELRREGVLLWTSRMLPPGLAAIPQVSASRREVHHGDIAQRLPASRCPREMDVLCEWILRVCAQLRMGSVAAGRCLNVIASSIHGQIEATPIPAAKLSYGAFATVFPLNRERGWTMCVIFRVVQITGISDEAGAELMRDVLGPL